MLSRDEAGKTISLFALAGLLLLSAAGFLMQGRGEALPAIAAATGMETVFIIDAGHGGIDGGASSPDGRPESRYNLEIAQKTDLVLRFLGARTIMTRREDISLHTSGTTIREKKISDLRYRINLVNSQKRAVLLSIHQNIFSSSRYYGPQIFYGKNPDSKTLAAHMQNRLSALAPGSNRQTKGIDTLMFNEVTPPSVLVECGFLSNPGEEALLRDGDYQIKLAATMAVTLAEWGRE